MQAETPPEQLADMVFEAIKAEKFYIFPHPTANVIMADRLGRVLEQRNPENILKMMGMVS